MSHPKFGGRFLGVAAISQEETPKAFASRQSKRRDLQLGAKMEDRG